MSELIKAADDARRLLRGFKAFEEVATALELAGVAEQRTAEADAKLAGLQAQINQAQADLERITADGAAAKAAAEDRAREIVQGAIATGEQVRAEAQASAQAVKAEADAYLAAKSAEVDALVATQRQAEEARDALAAEVKDLEARAEKARAYLAKLAG